MNLGANFPKCSLRIRAGVRSHTLLLCHWATSWFIYVQCHCENTDKGPGSLNGISAVCFNRLRVNAGGGNSCFLFPSNLAACSFPWEPLQQDISSCILSSMGRSRRTHLFSGSFISERGNLFVLFLIGCRSHFLTVPHRSEGWRLWLKPFWEDDFTTTRLQSAEIEESTEAPLLI